MTKQLTLNLTLHPNSTFDNFYNAAAAPVLNALQQLLKKKPAQAVYIYGKIGMGCSHLLQATCHAAGALGLSCSYLSLAYLKTASPDILHGLENIDLVAIDDLAALAGHHAWEEALFHFYNRAIQKKNRIVIAASNLPANIGLHLPDLVSRLQAMLVLPIPENTDAEKLLAIQMQANTRGLELSEEVGQFLLNRTQRDMASLCRTLDQLDQASLAAQRRLTIPFLKMVLGV